jgi:hypothetical protein
MLTNQLADEHRHVNQWADMRGTAASPISGNSVIEPNLTPAIAEAVDARITNYREDRNFAKRTNMPQSSLSRDTAREVGARFSRRQYFGDGDARNHTGYGLSSTYFRQIVDRDPRFVDAMIKLDTATSLFEGNPQSSVAFLGQSLIRITPEMISFGTPAYYLWFYKGVDQLLFLGDPFAAKRSYRMAMNWMEKSPIQTQQKRDLMARTEQTIQFLERNPKSQSAQIGAWASLLGNLVDPRTIARVMTEIRNLGGEIYTAPDGRVMVRVPPNIN